MSLYRKAFLVWWTALVLFIAVFLYINRDLMPPMTSDSRFPVGLAMMIFAFGSWIPGAFLRLLPQ